MSEGGRPNLLATPLGRRVLFGALYLSEGAPIGYVWWALPAMLRYEGVPIEQVTQTTATVTLVWALKFLWAPLVDTLRSPRWGLRNWIITAQLGMGLALLPLILTPFEGRLGLLTTILFIHALFATTQDASVDALCISTTPRAERGAINGWMQVGMLLGRALFGGVALAAEGYIGRQGVMLCLLLMIWSSTLLVLFFTREPADLPGSTDQPASRQTPLLERLGHAFARPLVWLAIGFALVGGASFEATGAVASAMLIDLKLSKDQVGYFFALPVIVSMGLGALAGGALADRLGHARAVAVLTAAIALVVLGIGAVHTAFAESGATWIERLLALLYLLYGAFAASSYAMFMDITDPALGATQFSTLMAATNVCEFWAVLSVGQLVASADYGPALSVFALVSLASIPLVLGMRRLQQASGPPNAATPTRGAGA